MGKRPRCERVSLPLSREQGGVERYLVPPGDLARAVCERCKLDYERIWRIEVEHWESEGDYLCIVVTCIGTGLSSLVQRLYQQRFAMHVGLFAELVEETS